MLFDRLCKMVERFSPGGEEQRHIPLLLQEAKLFEFVPESRFNTVPKPDNEFINEHFFLPFNVVAVERPNFYLILLHDSAENARGLNVTRGFVTFHPVVYGDVSEALKKDAYDFFRSTYGIDSRDCYLCCSGTIRLKLIGENITGEVNLQRMVQLTKHKIVSDERVPSKSEAKPEDVERFELHSELASALCQTAFATFIYLNSRDLFIVENSPLRKIKPGGKQSVKEQRNTILRSDLRPIYSGMRITEIREKLGLGQTVSPTKRLDPGASKSPHPRRRHFRILRSEHWGENQGKVVKVRSTWVGSREVTIENRRYKVLVDI